MVIDLRVGFDMRHIPNGSLAFETFDFQNDIDEALQRSTRFDSSHWLYVPPSDKEYRFILGEIGERSIICVGVNLSSAKPNELDPTLARVRNLSMHWGYDGYLMVNISAQRATNPDDMERNCLKNLHIENLKAFEYVLAKHPEPEMWAAWGSPIEKRNYLLDYLIDIKTVAKEKGAKWLCAGMTKRGHPRHPLHLEKDAKLETFDFDDYLTRLSSCVS